MPAQKAAVKKAVAAPAPKKAVAEKKKAPAAKKTPAPAVKAPAAKKAKVDATAAKKKAVKKAVKKVSQRDRILALIHRPAKSFRIGQDLPPKASRNLTRFVKWPRYIRLQRQKRILMSRLKTPPPLNQFNHSLDKATAATLFKMLHKYRPEERKQKQTRRLEAAKLVAEARQKDGKKGHKELAAALAQIATKRPVAIKFGLNNVTTLVERAKASLVVIAHDVDPIELVVWLPALCRKKGIPYCIVKGKSRLGKLVHRRTASVVALTKVRKEDEAELGKIVEVCSSQFLHNEAMLKQWSEPTFGVKHRQAQAKIMRRVEKAEKAKASA